jgi:tight adherence protein B
MIAPNNPIPTMERRREFSGLLRENQQFATGSGKGMSESVNGWFDRLMIQSGIQTSPMVWLGLCLVSALGFGGMMLVLSRQELTAAFFAITGLLLPIGLAIYLRNRRQTTIMNQLSGMADELARSARAGRNLEQSLLLVASDTPSPLGDELKVSARRMEMGLDVASSVRDLADRTGVSTLTIFSSALSLHQDTGGDLIMVLERLATAVRDRLHFVARQRAATVASRWGAAMMIMIPFGVMMIYTVWYPDYLTQLTGSSWGRKSLWLGVMGLLTGSFFVYRILARSARF